MSLKFDHYCVNRTKTSARMQRLESSRVRSLLLSMPTPQKQVILSVTKNKVQSLLNRDFYVQATSQSNMIIAGAT